MGMSLVARRHESRHARRRSTVGIARVAGETLLVSLAALAYFLVRGLMHGQESAAIANATVLMDFERRIGLDQELALQALIVDSDLLVTIANRIYIFWHWPVIAATLAWLIWKHGEDFALYRSALLISGAIGLVFFLLLPVAPPRLMSDYGFVDTVTLQSEAYRVLQPPSLTNPYAALPSLHVGWNLLMGIAIVRHGARRWTRAVGWAMPAVMWLATVVTANHYLLDGIVGAGVALTGLAVAAWLGRERHRVDSGGARAYDTKL